MSAKQTKGRNPVPKKIFPEDNVTKSKKILTALIFSSIIISSSGCETLPEVPVISPETSSELSESSSSLSESEAEAEIIPESSETEETVEAEPVLKLSSYLIEKGDYFIIKAENVDFSEVVFKDFLGNDRRFFENEGAWYCFVPVKPDTEPGYYPIKISSEESDFICGIIVKDKEFKKQYLVVEQATLDATLEDTYVREAFAEFFEEKRWNFSEEKLWEGEFKKPLGDSWYKETTSFGTFRTFSSGRTEWHDAIDMAVGGGTPIYATNSGRIYFADWLGLTGNTVIIDHGCGIMSWHYHLHKINVAEGDYIEKGTVIGTVGTTGLSTGNHLHFGITVGGVFVDPNHFFGTEPNFDFEKVKTE